MSSPASGCVLVGLDGGATSAKACAVERGPAGLRVRGAAAERTYARIAGFRALAREQALARPPSRAERDQARAWIEAAAEVVAAAAHGAGGTRVLLGACMPGEKTPDGRGVAWARHGPRLPDLLARLELELQRRGLELAAPVAGLYSDGDCCGWGEELGEGGLFGGVRSAWYAGVGTGLAEALKLRGALVAGDAVQGPFAKAWQLTWREGVSFEDALSMAALNARAGGPLEERADTPAGRGAQEVAAEALAELCARRARDVETLGAGSLERVVVGQRLGLLLADARLELLRARLEDELERRGLPRAGWLVASRLRAAPALGAAARAEASAEGARG